MKVAVTRVVMGRNSSLTPARSISCSSEEKVYKQLEFDDRRPRTVVRKLAGLVVLRVFRKGKPSYLSDSKSSLILLMILEEELK